MRVSLRSQRGFTLIELMITCSLIGVMAAIAIPNFMRYQAKARRSEGISHVAGIARAYIAYHADQGKFPDMLTEKGEPTLPDFTMYNLGMLGTAKLPWDAATEDFFKIVGWKPEGKIYYSYEVVSACDGGALGGGACNDSNCFTVVAHGDVDANGTQGAIMYVHPLRDDAGAPAAWCGSDFGYTVPIHPQSGNDIFEEPAVYQTDPY